MNVVLAQNVSLENHLALSTYLRSLAKYLARREEIDLYLMVQGPAGGMLEVSSERIHFIAADTYSLRGNAAYAWKLYRALGDLHARTGIDLIHCLYPNSSLQAAALFKRTRAAGVKIVYDIRSPWIEASVERLSLGWKATLYRRLAYGSESFLGRFVDHYVFITGGLKDTYQGKLGKSMEPSLIVPSGVDLDIFSRRDPSPVRRLHGLGEDDVVIGYVGVISEERELDFALRALRELREHSGRYKMMFVGDGSDRARLQAVAAELGLEDNVIFVGRVDYIQVPDYISACDFGLCHLPDTLFFRHSFPMKVLEYAACGVPVLASRISAHEEITGGLPMILYSNTSPSNLAVAVVEAEGSSFPIVEAIRDYAWESIAADMARCYRDVAKA